MDRQLFLNDQEDLRFIVIGDWGSGRRHQKEVAEAMGNFCHGWSGSKCDFIISTGDKYGCQTFCRGLLCHGTLCREHFAL